MSIGTAHIAFPMGDASRVGEARRHAVQLAHELGFDDTLAGRVALVVTELGNNLCRHARKGRMLLGTLGATREIEVLALDEGPGIADLERSLGDGYSTGGTPGTGLGAVRRLAHSFDVHSEVPHGTVMVARLRAEEPTASTAAAAVRSGAISLPFPGEQACGDGWALVQDAHRAALMVADGLGHGPEAAKAAQEALRLFAEEPWLPLRTQLERAHAALRSTRGAAVTLVHADTREGLLHSAGAGNVLARVVSGTTDRTLLSQHGTVGLQMRTPEETTLPWPPHALLVVHSDGIESRWRPELLHPVLGRDPVLAAALLMRDHCRGRDDATVVVLRRKD
ncbi:MAG: SpoIIE family protein phosphatase [Pseudomonadota bacterium]